MQRIAFYTRVSTAEQTCDNQLVQLEQWAARASFQHAVVERFTDQAMSGRHQARPGLRALEAAVRRREVNAVVVVALDRIGRSLQHLTALLAEWSTLGVQLVSLREAVDTSTPGGRALMQIAGVFAEFESALIAERTRAGMRRAKLAGKRFGNAPLPRHKSLSVAGLIKQGESTRVICERLRVSRATVNRQRRALRGLGAR